MKHKRLRNLSLILLVLTLLLLNVVVAQEIHFNSSFCEDEDFGYSLLGDDFYVLCEENFVDQYYDGYEEFLIEQGENITTAVVKEAPENELVVDTTPESLFELLVLEQQGIEPSVNYTEFDYDLAVDTPEIIDNTTQSSSNDKTLDAKNNQDNSIVEKNDEFVNESFDSSIVRYLLFLGLGLFVLLIIYIIIHSLAKTHEEKQQLAVAYSYVSLLRRKRYSDFQIKEYFLEKGYTEEFINKVLKTQDRNP